MKKTYNAILFVCLICLTLFMFLVDISVGSVDIPLKDVWNSFFGGDVAEANERIVKNIRLNKSIVAMLSGAALSVSGLQMQTVFRNPLAGPYVLGISSGASLGVALFILGLPLFGLSISQIPFGMAGAAWLGSALILLIIGVASQRIKDIMVILILGIMFSSGVSAVVQILQYLSHEDALKAFIIWTMGSLGEVTSTQLYVLAGAVGAGLILAIATIKPLNLLLLGDDYAESMGLNLKSSRSQIFLSTTLLAGTVTAFCGPIGFVGMAIPHVARMTFANSDHRILLPATIFLGALILIICDIVSKTLVLPINAIAAMLGIPIIIFVVLRNKAITV